MFQEPVVSLIRRPESSRSIEKLAEDLLQHSDVSGILPTPVDQLIAAAEIKEPEDPEPFLQSFLSTLPVTTRDLFLSGWQKIRGIADLREQAIYIPRESNDRRRLFVKSHELGHQVIPWHQVNIAYRDDDLSLGADAQELFDLEANLFAAEIIFQGKRFTRRSRDYQASFEAVFQLADDHGASRHATLWRFIEDQDESLALLTYWPSQYTVDPNGYPVLRRGKGIGSPKFLNKIDNLEVPTQISTGHPWVMARDRDEVCNGEVNLSCNRGSQLFQWQTWWNRYTLFVMLRRRPVLSRVGRLLKQL